MGFTSDQFDRLPDRFKPESDRRKLPVAGQGAVEAELPLHDDIIKYCNNQRPRWIYVHSDPTRPTTIRPGTPDFIIFAPKRVLIIECKDRDGKLSSDQVIWRHEAERLGYEVHIIRSMTEFLAEVDKG